MPSLPAMADLKLVYCSLLPSEAERFLLKGISRQCPVFAFFNFVFFLVSTSTTHVSNREDIMWIPRLPAIVATGSNRVFRAETWNTTRKPFWTCPFLNHIFCFRSLTTAVRSQPQIDKPYKRIKLYLHPKVKVSLFGGTPPQESPRVCQSSTTKRRVQV